MQMSKDIYGALIQYVRKKVEVVVGNLPLIRKIGGLETEVISDSGEESVNDASPDLESHLASQPIDIDLLKRVCEKQNYSKGAPGRVVTSVQQYVYNGRYWDFKRAKKLGHLDLPTNGQVLEVHVASIERIETAKNQTEMISFSITRTPRNFGFRTFQAIHDYLVAIELVEGEIPTPGYLRQNNKGT